MFQTFSKAWGIKPKAVIISKVETIEREKVDLQKEEIQKEVEKPSTKPFEVTKPLATKIQENVLETKLEKIQETSFHGETVSLAYHKHIVFLLFLLNIISLVVVFLLAVLK
jgi:hypothetical protein